MNIRQRWAIWSLGAALLIAMPGWAQPDGPAPGAPPPPGAHPEAGPRPDGPPPPPPDGESRRGRSPGRDEVRALATAMGIDANQLEEEDIRELFEIVRMAKLARELNLDKEAAIAMMRTFDAHRKEYWELRESRRTAMTELKAKIDAGVPDAELSDAVEALLTMEKQGAEMKVESYRAAAEGLDPKQRAKLYVFLQEFDDEFRRMVWSARRESQPEHDGEGAKTHDDSKDTDTKP